MEKGSNDLSKKENDQKKKLIEDEQNHFIIDNYYSTVSCMLKLNTINLIENGKSSNLNLVAIGFAGAKIYLVDLSSMKTYQIIKEKFNIFFMSIQ